ncbi:MAG: type II toxin-antitoxin system RelE/ParE family toxin [Bacteroidetes bacterium]|nr:MAG: type II toxin-antitoxin system RelE/ParE family toxin [Bacteroidota bacterium]
MIVQADKSFSKMAKKLSHDARKDIYFLIEKMQYQEDLSNLDVKKMAGFTNFYRIRMGKYRIGFRFENNIITLIAVAKRDEIYKIFP